MKFEPDRLEGVNVISRYEQGSVWVNATRWTRSVLVPARGEPVAWPVSAFAQLEAAHFEALLGFEPEIVVFGSGTRLRFATPALQRPLIERGIGVETMDTGAACRTFNILSTEGRKVAVALLIEEPPMHAE